MGRDSTPLRAAALLAALFLAPPPVLAHARLARSQPAARAQIAQGPPRVYLWFSEPIEARFSTATVEGPGGARVDRGDPRVDSDDPTRLSVGLPALAPASYVIRYRVLSVDGHVVEGEIPFEVRPAP
jgi:methionine-rich copper-binding protein CopC